MKNKTYITILFYLLYIHSIYGQIPCLLEKNGEKINRNYLGELVKCESNGENQMAYIEYAYIYSNEGNMITCELFFKENKEEKNEKNQLDLNRNSEIWTFKLGSFRNLNGILQAKLSGIVLEDSNSWAYIDDKSTGIYTYSEADELETLHITFNVYDHRMEQTISWKVPSLLPDGKKFVSRPSEKKMKKSSNTHSFCELEFENDSVTVTNYITKDSYKQIENREKYKWYTSHDKCIIIEGYTGYEKMNMLNSRIMALQKINRKKNFHYQQVWFDEVKE